MDNVFSKNELFLLLYDIKDIGFTNEDIIAIEHQLNFVRTKMPENPSLFICYLNYFMCCCHGEIAVRLNANILDFEKQLRNYLILSLNLPEWSCATFFALCIGFHFIHDLKADKSYIAPDLYNPSALAEYKRLIQVLDVIKIEVEIECCYLDQFIELISEGEKIGINSSAQPIVWLELAEKLFLYINKNEHGKSRGMRKLVVPVFTKLIRCWYHSIDIDLVEKGVPCVQYDTYNIEQLAQAISERTGETTSKDNAIKFCLDNLFGAYLKSEIFNVRQGASMNHMPTLLELDEKIKRLEIDNTYTVPYEGLVRLLKHSDNLSYQKSTLKHLLLAQKISILHSEYRGRLGKSVKYTLPFLPLQQSLNEYILGIAKVIEPEMNQSELQIDFDNLVFIKHEVAPCLDKIIQKHPIQIVVDKTSIVEGNIHLFTKYNDHYEIKFASEKTIVKAGVGEQYIEYLLKNYNREIFCLDLVHIINLPLVSNDLVVEDSNLDEITDGFCDAFTASLDRMTDVNALDIYRKQLRELQSNIEDAEDIGDIEKCEKLKQERDTLLQEINSSTDKNGKPRKFPSAQEKARQAVSKAISRARSSLKESCPSLYEHLKAYLSVGNICVYNPPQKSTWN